MCVCIRACLYVCKKKKKKFCGSSVFECASVSIVLAYVHQFKGNKVCICMYVCMYACVCMNVCGSGGHALDMVWTSFLFIRGIWRAPGLICVCVCTLTTGPRRPSVPHVSHQEPQQLGVILVAVAHTVFIALPLVFLHHLF